MRMHIKAVKPRRALSQIVMAGLVPAMTEQRGMTPLAD
jgi:hypothetical protein